MTIRITPRIVNAYKHARKIYDACPSDRQTVALKACDRECDELYGLLGRTKPWDVEVFATIDIDAPRDWEDPESWHDAKEILTALENTAA